MNVPANFPAKVRTRLLTEGWESIDLFGEVLTGADPVPRLLHLGANPTSLDRYWDELYQDQVSEGEEEEDNQEGGGGDGGGGGGGRPPDETLDGGPVAGGTAG